MADDHRSNVHPLRTALAAQGIHLSALFFAVFENTVIPGNPQREPRLMAPPGPSTGGGKMARQNFSLIPVDEAEGKTVVIGWADSSQKRAELRSWKVVAEAHRQRFGQELDIPVGAYNSFMTKVVSFLREQGFTIERVDDLQSRHPLPVQSPARGLWLMWVLVLIATLAVGMGLGALFMTMSR